MGMRTLSPAEVHKAAVESLRLDSSALDLATVEAMASSLRRAAGLLCPCSNRTLIHAVVEPLRDLVDDLEAFRQACDEVLEALVAHGDLLEFSITDSEGASGKRALLHTAPPSFVRRKSGVLILLGIVPDGVSPLPEDIEQYVEHKNHVCLLAPAAEGEFADQLLELGYIELSLNAWTKAPERETAWQHLSKFHALLEGVPPSGETPGLLLLDPERSVRYYRGRWVEATNQTGWFVARRTQAYGADLWCYVEVERGNPVKLVDLPTRTSVWRGCDVAWHLQAAIDYESDSPQLFRLRPGPGDTRVIDFFSPVPMWARRRWDATGEPVVSQGCLFSYKFSHAEVEEELSFLRENLWLAELK